MTNDSGLRFSYESILSFFTSGLHSLNNWFQRFTGHFENSLVSYLIIFFTAIVIIGIMYFVFKMFFGILKLAVSIVIPIALVLLVVFAVRLYSKINFFNNSAVVTVAAADVKSGPFRGAETF